ncbi:hypothetical protein RRG08_005955 [Elysia crispata]|uniref:Uncharacterized protein n=1 Tax=Elysia crispata TaxID=231223 RepID=A0AAE0YQ49_9GAST|nr:hypothetical protein RRG08_005955 [Elysia crispata]
MISWQKVTRQPNTAAGLRTCSLSPLFSFIFTNLSVLAGHVVILRQNAVFSFGLYTLLCKFSTLHAKRGFSKFSVKDVQTAYTLKPVTQEVRR